MNNTQREVIYTQRDQVLSNDNLKELIFDMIRDTVDDITDSALTGDRENWDINLFEDKLHEVFDYEVSFEISEMNKEEISDKVFNDLTEIYNTKENLVGDETFRRIERYIMLEVLDSKWRQHLKDLTELREGIRLRSYGQRNPINDYKIVGYDIYNEMIDAIKRETGAFILKLKLRGQEDTENLRHEEVSNVTYDHEEAPSIEGEEYHNSETVERTRPSHTQQNEVTEQRKLSRRERRELERRKK